MSAAPATAITLARENLRDFSRLNVPRSLAGIARQWLVILAAITAATLTGSLLSDFVAIVVIATRQHALAVLMHDASHHLLHRNKMINDIVSNLCLSFPLFISTDRYRRHHLRHHRYLNSDLDPDRNDSVLPESRKALMLQLAADLLGVGAVGALTTMSYFSVLDAMFKPLSAADGLPRLEKCLAFPFFISIPIIVIASGVWWQALIFWIVPMLTALPPILRLRALAEHGACSDAHQLDSARTVDASLVERLLFAPCNVNYHLEHHLYPSVPFYHLPALSRLLREQENFAHNAHLNAGYLIGHPSVLDDIAPSR
jgi:fatty acid desaturase